MIGEHHAIDAAFARDPGVRREHQPLDDELTLPALADQSTCFQASWSRRRYCASNSWQHRRAALRIHVFEMRMPLIMTGCGAQCNSQCGCVTVSAGDHGVIPSGDW